MSVPKIYLNQTALRIKLDTGADISGASALLIKYTKPDGTTSGSWVAIQFAAGSTIIYYDLSTAVIDVIGEWVVWAHVTFADGRVAAGDPFVFEVYMEGT